MNMRRKLGDRRIRPRFDIVGDLFGTLETVLRLPLRNVGRRGALIHSHVPLPIDSVHSVTFQSDGQDASTEVRVVRVETEVSTDGERTYLIAVEFVSIPPVLGEQIERWLGANEGRPAEAEA